MKKVIISLLTLIATITLVNAQTNKGDWMVGGNVVISTPKDNSQVSFTPSGGYFFANNFVAGALVNVSFIKTGDEKNTDLSVGPFARYYFNLKNSSFKPFLHADYTLGNRTTTVPGFKTTNTTGAFLLGAGGAFFINSNVALEAVAGYNHTKVQSQDPANGFLFRIGFQVHLLGSEVERVRGKQ